MQQTIICNRGGGNYSHLIFQNNVNSMDYTWNITQNGQKDVNEEGGRTTSFQKDTQWWKNDSNDKLEDVGTSEGHFVVKIFSGSD